jgi:hypothetical protein
MPALVHNALNNSGYCLSIRHLQKFSPSPARFPPKCFAWPVADRAHDLGWNDDANAGGLGCPAHEGIGSRPTRRIGFFASALLVFLGGVMPQQAFDQNQDDSSVQ